MSNLKARWAGPSRTFAGVEVYDVLVSGDEDAMQALVDGAVEAGITHEDTLRKRVSVSTSNWYCRDKHGWHNYRQANGNREVEIYFSVRDDGLVQLRLKYPDLFAVKD